MRDQSRIHPTPGDIGLAACGDFDALRRLRDHWYALATGELVNPLIPKEEALPQLELLAEMAANGTNEPEDTIVLLVVYQIRAERCQLDLEADEHFAKQAVEAGNADLAGRWTSSAVEARTRLEHYRASIKNRLQHIIDSSEPHGAAMLVSAMTHLADNGDERAVPILEKLLASVTAERAKAIQIEVRKMEEATLQ